MGNDERNTTKSVTFDEENNIVREFNKDTKIEKGKPPSKQNQDKTEDLKSKNKGKDNTKGQGPKGKKGKKEKRQAKL